jgi:long-chain acyl-CoA synthetase
MRSEFRAASPRRRLTGDHRRRPDRLVWDGDGVIDPQPPLPMEMFDAAVARLGEQPLLFSFETPISAVECDRLVSGLAAGLRGLGVQPGDRIGLFLQNDPQFVIASLAVWRLGAITVPANPMLRGRELAHHLSDAGATGLIVLDDLFANVAAAALPETRIAFVVRTGAFDLCDERPSTVVPLPDPLAVPVHDLLELARSAPSDELPNPDISAGDAAVLTYTSGTTGPPKGAINTHGNIAFASEAYRVLLEVVDSDVILGIAPLYHVTGLTAHIGLGLAAAVPTVLAHRFDAVETARLTQLHGASVTAAAITAYLALDAEPKVSASSLATLKTAYSGGAPIPPAAVAGLKERLGLEIRPVYGLTETTGPTHISPLHGPVPSHPGTGALAVGRAVPNTVTRIVGEDGGQLGPGDAGEVAIAGPQIVPGYWENPEETANTFRDGFMHTGDIGILDEDGWLYLVDRSKDMIVASGFKVWPREVEDVLYEHPAVREAAVIGVPDEYRGETVWGYVSMKPGASVDEGELVAFCRERLAAYKYPRVVHVLDELPKTTSGKIVRRELRDRGAS